MRVACQTARISQDPDRRHHGGVEPTIGIGDELRIGREARHQGISTLGGCFGKSLHLGPCPLRVDVIDRHWRDPAEVIDPSPDQRRRIVDEVRRSLDVNGRWQHDPCRGDGPEQLIDRGGRMQGHQRAGLRKEVLDDDLLDVSVLEV